MRKIKDYCVTTRAVLTKLSLHLGGEAITEPIPKDKEEQLIYSQYLLKVEESLLQTALEKGLVLDPEFVRLKKELNGLFKYHFND